MTYMSTTAECRLVLIPFSRKLRHSPLDRISHYWNKSKGTSVFTYLQRKVYTEKSGLKNGRTYVRCGRSVNASGPCGRESVLTDICKKKIGSSNDVYEHNRRVANLYSSLIQENYATCLQGISVTTGISLKEPQCLHIYKKSIQGRLRTQQWQNLRSRWS